MNGSSHFVHLDRAHQPGVATRFLQCVLHSQSVDHGRQHPHVVAGGAVNAQLFLSRAAKDVAAAHDDCNLHTQLLHFVHFARDSLNCRGMNAKLLRTRQGFARELYDDSLKTGAAIAGSGLCRCFQNSCQKWSCRVAFVFPAHCPAGPKNFSEF